MRETVPRPERVECSECGQTMTRRVWQPSPSTGWRAVYDAMSVPQPDPDVLANVPDRHGVIA